MNVTVYLHEPILIKAKERAKMMGISLSRLVETELEKVFEVDKKEAARNWIIASAKSGQFKGQIDDTDKSIKEERNRAERDFAL